MRSIEAVPGVTRYGFLHEPESRAARGRRIVRALADLGGVDLARAGVLDIGCSAGLITAEIARWASWVVGVDADAAAIRYAADAQETLPKPHFLVASGTALPFAASSFDAVICNHVYEHVDDPFALMLEVRRVLRNGGVCYCATGHTLQFMEPHHRLPLLSVLPRRWADAYVRFMGRAPRYDERFLPPWRLRSLFVGFSNVELISVAMLQQPRQFEIESIASLPGPLRLAVAAIARPLALAAPTWIWLARA